jgi:AraC-like DNA-binding protein
MTIALRRDCSTTEPMMTASNPSRIRFSTDDLPPDQRFTVWSEGFVHRRMDMEFIDRSPDGLRFTVEFMPLGGVSAGMVRGTASTFIRKPGADRNDTLYMTINRRGRFRVVQQDATFELAVGDAAVFDNRRSSEFHCLDEGETWSISVPREALRLLVRDIDATIERHIPASNPALRLLVGYLETLFALDHVHQPALAGVHIADLVASALGVRQEAQATIEERGVRAARLRAVLDAIAQGAGRPDLDPSTVAGELGVSVRYLHRLLQDTGMTFSEHVLDRRLERAHRLLRDPRLAHRKIGDLALQAGFSDLSHFNRSFRRRFGLTPSTARADALRKENE